MESKYCSHKNTDICGSYTLTVQASRIYRYSPDILSELYHNTEDMSMPFFKIPRKRIKYPKLFMRFISDNTEFCKAVDNISYRPIILMTPV